MKYALQIHGQFRTFDRCLPDILKYINFDQYDYDVFILTQRNDQSYSLEKEERIRQMLKSRTVCLKYIEDYDESVSSTENALVSEYYTLLHDAVETLHKEYTNNEFVTRLWFRRRLLNEMRKNYEQECGVKYDWVIRTRFDISFKHCPEQVMTKLSQAPLPRTIYLMPDTFSCGSAEVINYESELTKHWPFVYRMYKKLGYMPSEFTEKTLHNDSQIEGMWLFMSEANLLAYLYSSEYDVINLKTCLWITRATDL